MTDAATPEVSEEAPLFDAVLRPHRSLSARGFLILMLVLAVLSFAAGVAFISIGAWPVFGFFGLDVLAVYIAFRLNYRSGRAYEAVRLTESALSVLRVDWRGRARRETYQPYWLRVEFDAPAEDGGHVLLASHGKRRVIAACLSPDERVEFAAALREALDKLRRPAF